MASMSNAIQSPIRLHRLPSLRLPPNRTVPANFLSLKCRSLASKALNSPSLELSSKAIGLLSFREPLKSRSVVRRPVVRAAAAADADGSSEGFDSDVL